MVDREWIDDDTIAPTELLWRGVTSDQTEIEAATGRVIPTEGAFRTQQVSMNVASETTAEAVIAKLTKTGAGPFRLWSVTAKRIRDAGCRIVRDAEAGDDTHVVVVRNDSPGKTLTGGMATKMRRNGYWDDEGPQPQEGPQSQE